MTHFESVSAIFVLILHSIVQCIPIDNGIVGEPEIECGSRAITVSFNTRNDFEGNIYVKGLFSQPNCRNSEGGKRIAALSLPFDNCNIQRERSLNPRGIFVRTTVVISFHPQFITKIDKAYRVQCFYMEADKTVSSELDVSALTTQYRTINVPMPTCRYQILDGNPNANPIRYAIVGQQVYHKWTCETNTFDTFCMVVHSCFVDDGNGDKFRLLDDAGCAMDKYLLRNLEYGQNLMAGQEAHVFKYADRPQLFFQCQIGISIKEPNSDCSPPSCPEPQRGKRQAPPAFEGNIDVSTTLSSLDLEAPVGTPNDIKRELSKALPNSTEKASVINLNPRNSESYCIASGLVTGTIVLSLATFIMLTLVISYLVYRTTKKKAYKLDNN